MIYHLVPRAEWVAEPDRPYRAASLETEGFIHCSPDEATTLAVANAYYGAVSGPLLAVRIDGAAVTERLAWEPPSGSAPPGIDPDTRFPHLYGPLDRAAVTTVFEVRRDAAGRFGELIPAERLPSG